jgi:D-glycero-beta-D-manno-heptose-7-phosphate kinase
MNISKLNQILAGFKRKKVMVLGDFVADEYLFGLTSRISREAPVLILRHISREIGLGGAGNAAHNLSALGARVTAVGVVGNDEVGRESLRLLAAKGVETGRMIVEKGRHTTTKTRILAGGTHTTRQQVLRIDRGEYNQFSSAIENKIIKALNQKLKDVDAVLISDYQYGVLSPKVVEKVNAIARSRRLIVTVDSRYQMLKFRHVTALTPNEPEVEEALGIQLNEKQSTLRAAGEKILKEVKSDGLLITRGRKGMALFMRERKVRLIPVFGSDEVTDVTGAGDTVVSILTLALAAGASHLEAAQLANMGGGIVVMKQGAATVRQGELKRALLQYSQRTDSGS